MRSFEVWTQQVQEKDLPYPKDRSDHGKVFELAEAALASGHFQLAYQSFGEADSLKRTARGLLGQGIAADALGEIDDAGACCYLALKLEIEDVDLLVDFATLALRAEQADWAQQAAERALALSPDDPEAAGLLAEAEQQLESW